MCTYANPPLVNKKKQKNKKTAWNGGRVRGFIRLWSNQKKTKKNYNLHLFPDAPNGQIKWTICFHITPHRELEKLCALRVVVSEGFNSRFRLH